MKHSRLALAVALTLFTSYPALGASLTMLQFGSFETRAEAEKRLSEVTAKHAAFLGKLATNIREIKLPPDNLTVYRTQAGPVESRTAAQSICAQLASAGDECYIVQTAMTSAPASAAQALGTAATATVATTAAAATSAVADAKNEVVSAVTPAPDLTSKLSTLRDTPARDPLNQSTLNSIATPSATETLGAAATEVAVDAVQPQSEQVSKALDAAIENQPKVEADLANATKPGAIPQRGFWSRFNPFSSSDAPVKAPPAPQVSVPEASAAPIEAVASQALAVPAVVPENSVTLPAPPAAAALAVPTLETPVASVTPAVAPAAVAPAPVVDVAPAPAVIVSRSPITLDTRPVITQAESLPLPPPPAPLKAQDRALLAAAQTALPKPEPIAAPALAAPLPLTAANGSVQVEEAKRVPVTQAFTPPPAPAIQAVPLVRAAPLVSLSPSATEGQKAVWAQIGPFASNELALAYWASYRQTHPDFPVVRVRVASSYQQQLQGNAQSWLRVGPVAQAGFVTSLCASLGPNTSLRCGMMRDLGTSSPFARANGEQPTARYKR